MIKKLQYIHVKKILILLFLLPPLLIVQGCFGARTPETLPEIPEKAYPVIEGIAPFEDEQLAMDEFNNNPAEVNRKKLAMIREAYALNFAIPGEEHGDETALEFALLYAESAAELDPDKVNYWLLAGQLLMGLKGNIAAIAEADYCFTKAVELDPENVTALILLGQTQFAVGMYREALDNFEDALERDAGLADPEIISVMTISYIRGKEDKRGIRFYTDLLKIYPGLDAVRLSLAVLLNNTGKTSLAVRELEKVENRKGASDDNRTYVNEILEMWGYRD